MAFGFGVGDIIAVAKIAKGLYKACKDGPAEYDEVCTVIELLTLTLQRLAHDAEHPKSPLKRKGGKRMKDLERLIRACEVPMNSLQCIIERKDT